MSYNAKNHFEQGGERFVVGGELAFEEGAGVTGFPSDAAFFILDLTGVDFMTMTASGIDITSLFPVEVFRRALAGEKPVLMKNIVVDTSRISLITNFTDGESIVTATCGLPNEDGSMHTVLSVTLCLVDNSVFIRADANERLAALINEPENEEPDQPGVIDPETI